MDFAFMFIPHEAIYDLLINKIGLVGDDTENIPQRAAAKWHTSSSFHRRRLLAYLQTVLQGLRALQIESRLSRSSDASTISVVNLAAYEDRFKSVGKHL